MKYVGRILVEDASGCRLEIHHYQERRLIGFASMYRFDTGEPVLRLDSETFVIASTGERLRRVNRAG